MKIARLAAIIPLTIAAAAQFGSAHAATLTVCPSGCEHTTIQGAISHAGNGDTILIEKGHYFEVINTQGKALTLQGVDSRQAIIDANGIDSVITIPGLNPVTISNLTITRGYGRAQGEGGGISVTGLAPLTLTNSVVVSNFSVTGGGGLNVSAAVVDDQTVGDQTYTISDCEISDNQTSLGEGGAIYIAGGRKLAIDGSTIARNFGADASGIWFWGSTGTISNTRIVDNTEGAGIDNGGTLVVKNSTISGNVNPYGGGGVTSYGGTQTFENVVVSQNQSDVGAGIAAFNVYNGKLGTTRLAHTILKSTYIIQNMAAMDGGGTELYGTVTNEGDVVVENNSPNNCATGTVCP